MRAGPPAETGDPPDGDGRRWDELPWAPLVMRITRSRMRRSRIHRPSQVSLAPFPYTAAVSKAFEPPSRAVSSSVKTRRFPTNDQRLSTPDRPPQPVTTGGSLPSPGNGALCSAWGPSPAPPHPSVRRDSMDIRRLPSSRCLAGSVPTRKADRRGVSTECGAGAGHPRGVGALQLRARRGERLSYSRSSAGSWRAVFTSRRSAWRAQRVAASRSPNSR